MKGLFLVTWDYYRWEDLVAVSEYADRLEEHVSKLGDYPLYGEGQSGSDLVAAREEFHYVIKEVDEL